MSWQQFAAARPASIENVWQTFVVVDNGLDGVQKAGDPLNLAYQNRARSSCFDARKDLPGVACKAQKLTFVTLVA
jgi:hypothetical protein